jgi:hypothetical protein
VSLLHDAFIVQARWACGVAIQDTFSHRAAQLSDVSMLGGAMSAVQHVVVIGNRRPDVNDAIILTDVILSVNFTLIVNASFRV